MTPRPFYYKETAGVRVMVRSLYLDEHSQPAQHSFVFAYFVRIENVSRRTIQLLSRHWHIYDSIGEEYEVVGDGVVGEQPILTAGAIHEYQSFCVLKSPSGFMEGSYRFVADDAAFFDAAIPRFVLSVEGPL